METITVYVEGKVTFKNEVATLYAQKINKARAALVAAKETLQSLGDTCKHLETTNWVTKRHVGEPISEEPFIGTVEDVKVATCLVCRVPIKVFKDGSKEIGSYWL